jgi:hypothetical protein
VLNLVPLAGPRGEMAHRNPNADLVRKPLQGKFPQPGPTAIASPAIRRHQ